MELENLRKDLHTCIWSFDIWSERIRAQSISEGDSWMSWNITTLENVLKYPQMQDISGDVLEWFSSFLSAYEERDYVLAADYIESGMLPLLQDVVREVAQALPLPKIEKMGYQVEYTSSGATTLVKTVGGHKKYLHSNLCPRREGLRFTDRFLESGVSVYHVAGLGFGYHAAIMSRNPLIQINVYEEDKNVIELARKYSDAWETLELRKHVTIIEDEGYKKFVRAAQECENGTEQGKVCLYYPSIQTIADSHLRENMENLFLQIDNSKCWENHLMINFKYNTKHISREAGMLQNQFEGKTVFLIAGGPSLDKNIHLLNRCHSKGIILTVGTSLRRLLSENIRPDYVFITDPKPGLYGQVAGLETCGVPLILLSTALYWITRDYQGEKYIVCQEGYAPAERFAEKQGWSLYETGGSVVTTALDFCIQMGVERVVFLGLDLAFTGGKSHHGLQGADMKAKSDLTVEDIYGNPVVTSKNLNTYRQWIEKRIAREKQISFIDATEGGARVTGTKVDTLDNLLTQLNPI